MPTENPLVERAAAFIALANEQASSAQVDQVAGSMMLATARYCTHVVASGVSSAAAMRQEREAQLDFITQNFRTLLEGEYDFYTNKFTELVRSAPASKSYF